MLIQRQYDEEFETADSTPLGDKARAIMKNTMADMKTSKRWDLQPSDEPEVEPLAEIFKQFGRKMKYPIPVVSTPLIDELHRQVVILPPATLKKLPPIDKVIKFPSHHHVYHSTK